MKCVKAIELTEEEILIFDALYLRFFNYVLQKAYAFCHDRGDAEDIAQETFIVLARALREEELMKYERLDIWLWKTVKNQFRNYRRTKMHSPPIVEVEIEELPYEAPEDGLAEIENLDYLTPAEQKILRYHLYGFTLEDVARMVGTTPDYCRKKHSKIIKKVESRARKKKLLK